MKHEVASSLVYKEEELMKRTLLYHAIDADIVIDLHCDSDAIVHMYTHDRLWPTLQDLAAGKSLLYPCTSNLELMMMMH